MSDYRSWRASVEIVVAGATLSILNLNGRLRESDLRKAYIGGLTPTEAATQAIEAYINRLPYLDRLKLAGVPSREARRLVRRGGR